MQSHFNANTLAEIFRDLYISERRGVLTLEHEAVEKRIFVDRGLIFYADSNQTEDDLGVRLIEEGKISTGALEEARRNTEIETELAHVLVTRDLVSRAALHQTVLNQINSVVRSAFQWDGGSARFCDLPRLSSTLDSDVLTTAQVLLNGILDMANFQPILDALVGVDRPLVVVRRAPVRIERLTLSPIHGFVLSRLDGTTSFKDVVSIVPPGEEEGAARFIYGLLVLGVVRFDPPISEGPFRVATILREHADRQALEHMQLRTIQHAYETMAKQDACEILGVEASTPHEQVERAYHEAKATFSAERLLETVRTRMRTELTVIESRLIEAYLRICQPEPEEPATEDAATPQPAATEDVGVNDLLVRRELDKTDAGRAQEKATRVAESYFAQARKAVREGDYHNAIQYAKLAISYNDAKAEYYVLLAECQVRNPGARWQHLAEQNFTKATQLDPWNTENVMSLGRFYKQRGLKLRARKQFEEVLRLHPEDDAARKELKTLD